MKIQAKKLIFSGLIGMITLAGFGAETTPPVNLLKKSENLTAGEWKTFNRNAVIDEQASLGPDKSQNAFHVQIKGGFIGQVLRDAVPGHTYSFSVWMKSATGATQEVMLAGENNPKAASTKFQPFQVTGEWQKFTLIFDCPKEGNYNFRFSIRTCDAYVAAPEVIDITKNQ